MFGSLGLFAILYTVKQIIKEARQKPLPANSRFDSDAYWEDVRNGKSAMYMLRKQERFGYETTKPKPEVDAIYREVVPGVAAYKYDEYLLDIKIYGKKYTEKRKNEGYYKQILKPLRKKQ